MCVCVRGVISAKSLRTPSNVFVVNLAFCDFIMMSKTPIFIYNSFNLGYALGSTGCQIYSLMGALSGIGAAMTNAFIAYDRLSNSWHLHIQHLFVGINRWHGEFKSNFKICLQISCYCQSSGWKINHDKSHFFCVSHLVLCHSMGYISIS